MTITQAAVKVLEGVEGSLHYREIARQMLDRAWVTTESGDPMNCIHSTLWNHVRKQGERSWFVHEDGGSFRLSEYGRRRGGEYPPTWLEATEEVLREADRPLHTSDIYRRIIERGLKRENGRKWKGRLVGNLLAAEVKTCRTMGREPPFERVAPATYVIRS